MPDDDTVTIPRSEYLALVAAARGEAPPPPFMLRGPQHERLSVRPEALEGRAAPVHASRPSARTDAIPEAVADAIRGGATPILAFRRHHGLTLRELSDRSGVALGYLSEIERGRRPGTITAWSRIAAALGTTIDVLVHGVTPRP